MGHPLRHFPESTVAVQPGEYPITLTTGKQDMTTIKLIAHRAFMFLGSIAVIGVIVVDNAKRW